MPPDPGETAATGEEEEADPVEAGAESGDGAGAAAGAGEGAGVGEEAGAGAGEDVGEGLTAGMLLDDRFKSTLPVWVRPVWLVCVKVCLAVPIVELIKSTVLSNAEGVFPGVELHPAGLTMQATC